MNLPVTVISGMDPRLRRAACKFAQDTCGTGDVELILQPGTEAALARAEILGYCGMQLFALRDVLRTKAALTIRGGPRQCLIIGSVACRKSAAGFEECVQFVRRECREVARWGLFRTLRAACVTPDLFFEVIV